MEKNKEMKDFDPLFLEALIKVGSNETFSNDQEIEDWVYRWIGPCTKYNRAHAVKESVRKLR